MSVYLSLDGQHQRLNCVIDAKNGGKEDTLEYPKDAKKGHTKDDDLERKCNDAKVIPH